MRRENYRKPIVLNMKALVKTKNICVSCEISPLIAPIKPFLREINNSNFV